MGHDAPACESREGGTEQVLGVWWILRLLLSAPFGRGGAPGYFDAALPRTLTSFQLRPCSAALTSSQPPLLTITNTFWSLMAPQAWPSLLNGNPISQSGSYSAGYPATTHTAATHSVSLSPLSIQYTLR